MRYDALSLEEAQCDLRQESQTGFAAGSQYVVGSSSHNDLPTRVRVGRVLTIRNRPRKLLQSSDITLARKEQNSFMPMKD